MTSLFDYWTTFSKSWYDVCFLLLLMIFGEPELHNNKVVSKVTFYLIADASSLGIQAWKTTSIN